MMNIKTKHASLFSGIGGFDLAASWCGWDNVFQVEIDKFCQKVLTKNFPKTKRYEDIKKFTGTKYKGTIDIISAGVPCQPASVGGARKGEKDSRWLWPEAIRIFKEIKPTFIICENPIGITNLEDGKPFERILSEMATIGYTTEIFNIPAASGGAWHRRERIWIIAYANKYRNQRKAGKNESKSNKKQLQKRYEMEQLVKSIESRISANSSSIGLQRRKPTKSRERKSQRKFRRFDRKHGGWEIEPRVDRVVNGFSSVMDRSKRIKALGNAVVPQIPYIIFKVIEKIYFKI